MLFYNVAPVAVQTTNAAANTENDALFITPGALRGVAITAIYPQGRGANLTSISGLTYRLKKWTTTASSAGTAITPAPTEAGYAVASATAGFAAGAVTSGTGGPTTLLVIGSGTTTPGNWMARSVDDWRRLYAGETKSMDIFNVASAVSLSYEMSIDIAE